ncbi:MAG: putative peptidoglycan glycosyltransferase FtsW [Anaerolineaceae bacterium]|nr:putative peptidoglycan glycosyltransferase FtsW [Anaerolineaceae bacterium]MDE0329123.1 putative peptidoglycan glycosyltransferase FtsW [Anaerolineaceae bacterium]
MLSDAELQDADNVTLEQEQAGVAVMAPAAGGIRRGYSWSELARGIDRWLLLLVGMLLVTGTLMVYSATFDWSYQSFGSEIEILLRHIRNILIGSVFLVVLALLDYRVLRRMVVWLLLITIGFLVAVWLFGDDTFGARRALIAGSFQPGEAAELVIVLYMAAWLSSRRGQIRSIGYGLFPFSVLVGVVAGLIFMQPDFSTAAIIIVTSTVMFFLAGADLRQLLGTFGLTSLVMLMVTWLGLLPDYVPNRVTTYLAGVTDLTQANYHVQQAIIAFLNGGWTGVGLGNGRQKFGFLPATHTDSIFAVIGEELGVLGMTFILLLYVLLVLRGFYVARRARDPFGALLAAGLTVWIAVKALLNIAVITAVVPSTGTPLPFVSFGGSSLVVLMAGTGLLLSVSRLPYRQAALQERRGLIANPDRSGRDRRARLSRAGRRRGPS